MTASIVARDPVGAELGIAVFSAYPSVGARVAFAQAGVGVVAIQGSVERSFGPRALGLLRNGASASSVVEELITGDPGAATRQVAVLAVGGEASGFTGGACVPHLGEASGGECRCQANMMAEAGVPEAMAAAFAESEGSLAFRLLEALETGQRAGGDARGRTSAAVLVVPAQGEPWEKIVDVRVDHHDDPLPDLRRALSFDVAYSLLAVAAERGRAGDGEGAMNAGLHALRLAPDDPQLLLWLGLGAAGEDLGVGVGLVQRALELRPSLAAFLARIPAAFMPAAPAVRDKLDSREG